MRLNKRFYLPILVSLFSILLISTAALAMANSGRETIQVALGGSLGNEFNPSPITIRAGDSVEWTNGGGFHNVMATNLFRCADDCDDGQSGDGSASGNLWSTSVTFTQTGVIDYFCEIHAGGGMTGQIVVLPNITINELRVDEPGVDKNDYVELFGDADASLDGLTYIVIGDSSTAAGLGGGVIEEVESLDGLSMPSSGFFLIAESSFTLTVPTITRTLNFENNDDVTHLLVAGFTGSDGDDLDTDDDGILDSQPWAAIVDAVGITNQIEVRAGVSYGAHLGFEDVSKMTGGRPLHVYRAQNGVGGAWTVGADEIGVNDSAGAANSAPLAVSVVGVSAESQQSTAILTITLLCLSMTAIVLKRRA